MTGTDLRGYPTSFHGMFGDSEGGSPRVEAVEVPLIQRDYAQGRRDPRSDAIRERFIDALHAGITTDTTVGLDFIYGDVRDTGHGVQRTFEPLDGQQRLTTLFLLHWYVAARRQTLSDSEPWTRFTYATRPSARLFCERIVKYPPPHDLDAPPSRWITDQSWYLHLWRFDPTIRAMLVTIDAIADRFSDEDPDMLWERLTDEAKPRVWFQLLPIKDMGSPENLYIKMNSRGKPLTDFEAFKAHLGQVINEIEGPHDFGHKIDGPWTDLFWSYRGDDDIVDDEFMRYFDFLIEVCEWREDRVGEQDLLTPEQRISRLLAPANPRHREHLDFIFAAFDSWDGDDSIADVFAALFTTNLGGGGVRLIGAASTDLFHGCCERYGETRGTTRLFSLTDTLLLLAVLIHRIEGTYEAQTRLRVLRNVNEASQFEMRVQNMPKFVRQVADFMRTGDLDTLATFNQNQIVDERAKRTLRAEQPELAPLLDRLEDHNILRGTLAAFELDRSIAQRAATFEAAFEPAHWPRITAALLATGEYQRGYANSDMHRFGSPTTEGVWRLLLVDRGDSAALERVRRVLGDLLDQLSVSDGETSSALKTVIDEFVASRTSAGEFDWRYYLVRYPTMREGNSGIYYGADRRMGYEVTMLNKTMQNSWYRDAYLYAMWAEAGRPVEVKDPWFTGYSTEPRWMELVRSGTRLRNLPEGIAVRLRADPRPEVTALLEAGTLESQEDGLLLPVPQALHEGELLDSVDRVMAGATLIRTLVDAGL